MAAKKAPPKKVAPKQSPLEFLDQMRSKGVEHEMSGTGRKIRLRTVDAEALLLDAKLPDILTPLVIRSVYQDLPDREVRSFLDQPKTSKEDALAMLQSINYICEKCIADGTKLSDLTLGEKRWIFRLVMGPAELLIPFREDEDDDVEPVDEVQDVP